MAQWYQKPPLGVPLIAGHPHLDGLVGWWPMLEGAGGQVYDMSGYGNDGTLTNMANPPTANSGWGAGQFGNALSFDGTNDNAVLSHSLEYQFGLNEFSVSAWIMVRSLATASFIYDQRDSASDGWRIDILSATGQVELQINGLSATSTNGIGLNRWYHVAGVRVGALVYLYINGTLESATAGFLARSISTTVTPKIGTRSFSTPANTCVGAIDDVRIYNRALTQSEIASVMLEPFAPFTREFHYAAAAAGLSMPVVMGQMDQFNGGAFL